MSILEVKMENKDKSQSKYDTLVNYKVCEYLYIHMKETNYTTFRNMCNNLKTNLETNTNLGHELNKLFTLTAKKIYDLYGMSYEETIKYIINFLNLPENTRTRYLNAILSIKKATPNSYFDGRTKKGGRGF